MGAYYRYAMAAQAGSRVGLANMAYYLEQGLPPLIQPNATAAFAAYSLAAALGDVPSLRRTGDMFYSGVGCARDRERALDIYLSNSEDAQSIFNAAWMYELAEGCGPDMAPGQRLARARELYLEAERVAAKGPRTVM